MEWMKEDSVHFQLDCWRLERAVFYHHVSVKGPFLVSSPADIANRYLTLVLSKHAAQAVCVRVAPMFFCEMDVR
jgi:hypothetical protein